MVESLWKLQSTKRGYTSRSRTDAWMTELLQQTAAENARPEQPPSPQEKPAAAPAPLSVDRLVWLLEDGHVEKERKKKALTEFSETSVIKDGMVAEVADELSDSLLKPLLKILKTSETAVTILERLVQDMSEVQFNLSLEYLVPVLRQVSLVGLTVNVVRRMAEGRSAVQVEHVGSVVGILSGMLQRVDTFEKETVLQILEGIQGVVSSEMGTCILDYLVTLAKTVARYTLLHKHKIVRIKAIDTITCILRKCTWKYSFDLFAHLTAWQDANVVPTAAFFDDDQSLASAEVNKVNYFAILTFDAATLVREHFFNSMVNWLLHSVDKIDFEHLLMPFLLTALTDEDPTVRSRVYRRLVDELSPKLGLEYAKELKELIQAGVDAAWTQFCRIPLAGVAGVPDSERPPLPLRWWVRKHSRKFVKALFDKYTDFGNVNHANAKNLLLTMICFLEEQTTEVLSEILKIPDQQIIERIAIYVAPAVWLDIVGTENVELIASLVKATVENLRPEISDLGPLEEVKSQLEQVLFASRNSSLVLIYVQSEKLKHSLEKAGMWSKFVGLVISMENPEMLSQAQFTPKDMQDALSEISEISEFTVAVLEQHGVDIESQDLSLWSGSFAATVGMWRLAKSADKKHQVMRRLAESLTVDKAISDPRSFLRNLKSLGGVEISDSHLLKSVLCVAIDAELETKVRERIKAKELADARTADMSTSKLKTIRHMAEEISDQLRIACASIFFTGVLLSVTNNEIEDDRISDLIRQCLKLWKPKLENAHFGRPAPCAVALYVVSAINVLFTGSAGSATFPISLREEAPSLTATNRPRRSVRGQAMDKPLKTLAILVEALVALNLPLPVQIGHPNCVIGTEIVSGVTLGRVHELPANLQSLNEDGLKWNVAWRLSQCILDISALHPSELATLAVRWDAEGLLSRSIVVNWLLSKITL